LLKRTSRLKSLSPLHPLRAEKIVEKEKEIEDDPAVEARVQRGTRYVTSFGMVNVRKERTVPKTCQGYLKIWNPEKEG